MTTVHDFEGHVRFLTPEEGGLRVTPVPGYRSNLRYVDQEESAHWMVFPLEFFTDAGDVPEGVHVPLECYARFWILDPELAAAYHKAKVRVGIEYEIYEGPRKVGVGAVTKLVGICDR